MANVTKRERIETTTTEPTLSGNYVELDITKYAWRCDGCGLVWTRKAYADSCESNKHVTRWEARYGGYVENGVWKGGRAYERVAIRRERVDERAAIAQALSEPDIMGLPDVDDNLAKELAADDAYRAAQLAQELAADAAYRSHVAQQQREDDASEAYWNMRMQEAEYEEDVRVAHYKSERDAALVRDAAAQRRATYTGALSLSAQRERAKSDVQIIGEVARAQRMRAQS